MLTLYKKTSYSLLNEIKQTINWIENHAKALSALVIFLSSITFYHYSIEERIPINITGMNFLTKAPTVFPIICLIIMMINFTSVMSFYSILSYIKKTEMINEKGVLEHKRKSILLLYLCYFSPAIVIITSFLPACFINYNYSSWMAFVVIFSSIITFFILHIMIDRREGIKINFEICFDNFFQVFFKHSLLRYY